MTDKFTRSSEEVGKQFEEADRSHVLWLVAELEGLLVGSADFQRGRHAKNSHTAEFGMAVRQEYRGLGIGEAILRAGIEWCRSVGVRKIKLGVFVTNNRAIHLYSKLGFVEEARLRGEAIIGGTPVDEILMALWFQD
jgi:RimJ/RimL family protein N-acetyltransferase